MAFAKFLTAIILENTCERLLNFQLNWEVLHVVLFIQVLRDNLEHDTLQIKVSSEFNYVFAINKFSTFSINMIVMSSQEYANKFATKSTQKIRHEGRRTLRQTQSQNSVI